MKKIKKTYFLKYRIDIFKLGEKYLKNAKNVNRYEFQTSCGFFLQNNGQKRKPLCEKVQKFAFIQDISQKLHVRRKPLNTKMLTEIFATTYVQGGFKYFEQFSRKKSKMIPIGLISIRISKNNKKPID